MCDTVLWVGSASKGITLVSYFTVKIAITGERFQCEDNMQHTETPLRLQTWLDSMRPLHQKWTWSEASDNGKYNSVIWIITVMPWISENTNKDYKVFAWGRDKVVEIQGTIYDVLLVMSMFRSEFQGFIYRERDEGESGVFHPDT